MKYVYGCLCIAGLALPYYVFVPFVLAHGLDLGLIIQQLFAGPVGAFFGIDVIVSSLVLWVFVYQENRLHPIPFWPLVIIGNLAVGVSFGLPLFLLLREIAIERGRTA